MYTNTPDGGRLQAASPRARAMADAKRRPPRLASVDKRPLHDQVASRVRDLIIEGRLEPGARIDETALVEQLGVSRTPFREALRTLAAEGLVVIRPSRGAIVRKLAPGEVLSMLELLAEIERLAGRLAIERAEPAELEELLALHERMMARYRERERLAYYKLNQRFHSRVAELSGNAALVEVHENLQARLKRIRFVGNREARRWAGAVADHERMARAVRERDGEALGKALHEHLHATWERVRDTL